MLIQVKKVQQGDKIQPYMLYVNYADYFLLMDRMRRYHSISPIKVVCYKTSGTLRCNKVFVKKKELIHPDSLDHFLPHHS